MNLPIFQVDAFTDHVFGGNPAAVVLLDSWLRDDLLQSIAAENNLAETAFVNLNDPVRTLRWFTPTLEIDLCGHATLAAAHVLYRHGSYPHDEIRFLTMSGELTVNRNGDWLTLDFPSRPPVEGRVTQEIIDALGATPQKVLQSRDTLAVFATEQEVKELKPDFGKVAKLESFAIIASAPGDGVDFVSRFFAPRAGVPEDPVTGSAHCTLVPYWAEQLGKTELVARQISSRGGFLRCALVGDRVLMSGQAVDYLQGTISVSP